MTVKFLKTGKTETVNESFGLRCVQQGLAEVVPEKTETVTVREEPEKAKAKKSGAKHESERTC